MAITDWPTGERPRERLLKQGPQALSDAELLAIYLRVGIRGKSAVDLARELLQRFDGDLGRLPRDFPATWFEESIERLPNDHVRFTVRNIIALIPGAVLLGWPLLLLAPAQTAAYEIGWRRTPQTPTVTGEWLTGGLWGVFVWFLA